MANNNTPPPSATHTACGLLRFVPALVIALLAWGCGSSNDDTLVFDFAVVGQTLSEEELERYCSTLQQHMGTPLFEGLRIAAVSNHTVRVKLRRGGQDAREVERHLRAVLAGPPNVLDLRILAQPSPQDPDKYDRLRATLQESGPQPRLGDELGWFKIDDPLSFLDLETPADLTALRTRESSRCVVEKLNDDFYVLAKLSPEDCLLGSTRDWHLRRARAMRDDEGRCSIAIEFDETAATRLERLTSANIGQRLCILSNNTAMLAPNIQSPMREKVQITGLPLDESFRSLVLNLDLSCPSFWLEFIGRVEPQNP